MYSETYARWVGPLVRFVLYVDHDPKPDRDRKNLQGGLCFNWALLTQLKSPNQIQLNGWAHQLT